MGMNLNSGYKQMTMAYLSYSVRLLVLIGHDLDALHVCRPNDVE